MERVLYEFLFLLTNIVTLNIMLFGIFRYVKIKADNLFMYPRIIPYN